MHFLAAHCWLQGESSACSEADATMMLAAEAKLVASDWSSESLIKNAIPEAPRLMDICFIMVVFTNVLL